jgi:predicted tellurium resistance membrane protein TerC
MEWLFTPEALIALASLSLLEIVLGIDNIVFISILSSRLPLNQQKKTRYIGLLLALLMRIVLLFSIKALMSLTNPLFEILSFEFSGKDLILFGGGLFLIAKATFEIHEKLEGGSDHQDKKSKSITMKSALFQIVMLDVIFSLDSVITAVGMADQIEIMIMAVVIAMIVMMLTMNKISSFVEKHPTIKMLALSFLILIGFSLTAEGLSFHISKGYIYFAMTFSLIVELLNLKLRKSKKPIKLKEKSLN